MNYQIITDEARLLAFIDWLPVLAPDETYLVCLFARKKYAPAEAGLKADKNQLKRFTATKEFLLRKIRQLETALGNYTTPDGRPVPNEALALYLTVNPRSQTMAAKNTLIALATLITKDYNGYNAQQVALNEIQKACSRNVYIDLDFDGVDYAATMQAVVQHVNREAITTLVTRGGFHLLIEPRLIRPELVKTWYPRLAGLPGCDVRGDMLLPVPGCTQGGFTPYFTADF